MALPWDPDPPLRSKAGPEARPQDPSGGELERTSASGLEISLQRQSLVQIPSETAASPTEPFPLAASWAPLPRPSVLACGPAQPAGAQVQAAQGPVDPCFPAAQGLSVTISKPSPRFGCALHVDGLYQAPFPDLPDSTPAP